MSDPQSRFEHAESWSGYATILIFFGIVCEAALLLIFPGRRSGFELWGAFAADLAIGMGLIIEYVCIIATIKASGQLKAESDAKLAEALDRASNAESKLVEFRTARRMLMTNKARSEVVNKLQRFSGTNFDGGVSSFESEQVDILWDLEEVLSLAGWQQLPWPRPDITRSLRPAAGLVAAQNVEIQLDPSWRLAGLPAAGALIDALNDIGIEAREAPFNTPNTNVQAVHVVVGPKR